ncbi:MAG: thioredoxin domain-containing protein, partial [Candidatus Bipolaricaulota bacterium]|nr:thioredoxin domain-containing protein [Candidatus Bipolaricaulota bacterium]
GGTATLQISIDNKSLHPADDIAVSLVDADGFSLDPTESDIKVIQPFDKDTLDLNLVASPEVVIGTHDLTLQIIYTYCIEVSCFQIVNEVSVSLLVTTISIGPATVKKVRSIPPWVMPTVVGLIVLAGIGLWRLAGVRLPLYIALFVIVAGGLAYGVILGQHEQAQGIAAVLCTSCVGIEEAPREEPALSENALSALTRLDTDVRLIVFYAPWCHTCPYAEAMVQQIADATDHITYEFVNVDTNRDLAASNGVIRSNRTVVPAILRVDTREVIFGIENLEERLLGLLEVGQ